MRRIKPLNILYLIFSLFMCFVFVMGTYSFITVPAKARAEAAAIEEMLRKQQEEAEARKQAELAEAEKRKAEEAGQPKALEELYDDAADMHVTGIGDSVMLSALGELYDQFPEGYFDAVFGRTLYEALPVIYEMEENGTFGDVIVYSLVTNCDIEESDIEKIIEHSSGKPTFWITTFGVTNNGNEVLRNVIPRYDNAYLVEWGEIADKHWEWILADGLHLNHEGAVAYADLIRWTITSDLLTPEFATLKFKPITTRK